MPRFFSLKEPNLRSKTDVTCTWFENGKKKQGKFKQDMLKFADNQLTDNSVI